MFGMFSVFGIGLSPDPSTSVSPLSVTGNSGIGAAGSIREPGVGFASSAGQLSGACKGSTGLAAKTVIFTRHGFDFRII
jgi:hypothetical protein